MKRNRRPDIRHTTTKQLRAILDGTVECAMHEPQSRYQDDTDGSKDPKHMITVHIGVDGDMYIGQGDQQWLRFRNWFGGGASLRTHNALRILAEAIRLDNEEPHS